MAAEPIPGAGLTDLRFLRSSALDPLFEDEVRCWRERYDWDFTPSASLVRRFVDQQALTGFALIDGAQVVGYTYCVTDDPKGLIGDLYVVSGHRDAHSENRLLAAAVELLMHAPGVCRIETQLMMMEHEPVAWLPGRRYLHRYLRRFMVAQVQQGIAGPSRAPFPIVPWQDRYQEVAAEVLAESYVGHIDGNINDQYRSLDGARRFLFNIIQYPGCGTFLSRASFLAIDPACGEPCGLLLTSSVAGDTGHITQVCVAPYARGRGVGRELVRNALSTLRELDYRRCSLTVTAANTGAIDLYEQLGFTAAREFPALVWDGF
ncbi:MAG: GNAT family N-acetyltransferase [Bryobacteraceae bacterium]